MQKSKIFFTIRNTVIIFALTAFYCFVKNFDYTINSLYVLFLGDFSIAVAPRMLIGAILSIFRDTFDVDWMQTFLIITTFVTFFATSFYIATCMNGLKDEHRRTVHILTVIFLFFPFSISIFAGDIFGFIDVFCMIVLLICAFAVENRYLIWAFPVLICAGIFVHDAYITAYMAPCFGILIYYAITKYKITKNSVSTFVTSTIVGFATVIYRVFFSTSMVKMTEAEMIDYLANKGSCAPEDVSGYLEAFLYGKDVHNFTGIDYADNIFVLLKYMIQLTVDQFTTNDLFCVLSIIPILAIFFSIWIKAAKNAQGFFGKLPYILFMLTVIPQIASLVISVDISRFVSTFVIVQFIYLYMCIKRQDPNIDEGLDRLTEKPQHLLIPCLSTLIFNII